MEEVTYKIYKSIDFKVTGYDKPWNMSLKVYID